MSPVKKTPTKQARVVEKVALPQASRVSGRGQRPTLTSPHVIFEILWVEGMMWMVVRNIGPKPACHIRIKFEQSFKGLEGTKRMDTLPLFTQLEFLGPHREIQAALDRSAAYFRRNEPLRLVAHASFEEDTGRRYKTRSIHNLEVFRDLGYVHVHKPLS